MAIGVPDLNIDIDGDGYPELNIDLNGDNVADYNIDNGSGNRIRPSRLFMMIIR